MLYKVGKLDHSLCNCFCVQSFVRKGFNTGASVYARTKKLILAVLIINLLLQLTLTILDQSFENDLYTNMPVSEIL